MNIIKTTLQQEVRELSIEDCVIKMDKHMQRYMGGKEGHFKITYFNRKINTADTQLFFSSRVCGNNSIAGYPEYESICMNRMDGNGRLYIYFYLKCYRSKVRNDLCFAML